MQRSFIRRGFPMKYELSQENQRNSTQDMRNLYANTKQMLRSVPSSTEEVPLGFYKKQLGEQTRFFSYTEDRIKINSKYKKKHTTQEELQKEQEELQIAVISQVAENLWLNFCAKGKDSPMLRHLQESLRAQYGDALVFKYNAHSSEVFIMLKVNDCFRSLTRTAQLNLINRARQISQEVVQSYV